MLSPQYLVLISICLSTASLFQLAACTTNLATNDRPEDITDLNIDPDQKALPAENVAASDVQIKDDNLSAEKNSTDGSSDRLPGPLPPTPTVDEIDSQADSRDAAPVEPDAPIYDEVQHGPDGAGDLNVEVGSGPQLRFIKAAELNIREKPNRYSKIVGNLREGQAVRVKIQGDWAQLDEDRWIRSRWLVKKRSKQFSKVGNKSTSRKIKAKSKRPKKKNGVKKSEKKRQISN